MRRTKRPRYPKSKWMEGNSQEKEEPLLKQPRRSSYTGEPKERSTRKNHHFKTYERRTEAREASRDSNALNTTETMGTLVRTDYGKDNGPQSCGTETDSNTDTPRSLSSAPKAHHISSHTYPSYSHTQPRSLSRSRSSDSSPRTRRKGCDDDEEGHLVCHTGFILKERYEVVSTLGEGAFGKVVECLDRNKSERVALKIVKNIERFREAARSEIAVLEEILTLDDDNIFACVRMLDWFDHHGHTCIAFELLGLSTFDYMRENEFLPFSVEQIRHMALQIVRAVCFLHRNKMTHTDLKPENILFVCSNYDLEYNDTLKRDERTLRRLDVKVVDFGSAIFNHEHHPSVVSTRHYRAPEVILELGWNQACDVWSLGCILMEFYLGLTLFQTHNSKEHLAMMERVLGPIPPHLLKKTRKQLYVHRERLDWDEHSSSGCYVRKHCKPLKQYLQSKSVDHQQLFDLIGSMMEYDLSRRITTEEALWHPFFKPLRKGCCT